MLIDDLVYFFEEKKRLTNKNYRYIDSEENRKHFKKAAKLCEQSGLHPGKFVQSLYDNMGKHKTYFSPKHLAGPTALKILEEKDPAESYQVEITNATLKYPDIWRYQHEMAMMYIARGEPVESVLMDSSLKFFAWFRILSTPDRVPAIIKKYKHIAKDELNPKLREFIEESGLDIDRITA